jgi:dihydrofolate reductase
VVSIIVAHARNGVIGRDGGLPWHLPSDLRRFRELTTGHAVVMGRRTFETLPPAVRPLPDRRNVVLSSNPSYRPAGAEVFAGLDAALESCDQDCFVIGGGQIYRAALERATRVLATCIEADVDGDTYFPALHPLEWRCVEESVPFTEDDYPYRFRTYERRN